MIVSVILFLLYYVVGLQMLRIISDEDGCWLSSKLTPTPIPTRLPSAERNPTKAIFHLRIADSHIIGVARLFVFLFSMVIARVLRTSSPFQTMIERSSFFVYVLACECFVLSATFTHQPTITNFIRFVE